MIDPVNYKLSWYSLQNSFLYEAGGYKRRGGGVIHISGSEAAVMSGTVYQKEVFIAALNQAGDRPEMLCLGGS
jgi:hypothetical protein